MPLPEANLKHPSFTQPSDVSVLVRRYIDFPGLLWIVLNSKLPLIRLSEMPDLYEGFPGRHFETLARQIWANQYRVLNIPGLDAEEAARKSAAETRDQLRRNRAILYISSWMLGEHESEAMWRIYGQGNASVAVVTTYQRLRDSLPEDKWLYIGKVNYVDLERGAINPGNQFLPVMHKRHQFDHEKEVRIVRCDLNEFGSEAELFARMPKIHPIIWEPAQHLEKIILSPYAQRWQCDVVKETLHRINPAIASIIVDSEMSLLPD
jgi:hypothetical protein